MTKKTDATKPGHTPGPWTYSGMKNRDYSRIVHVKQAGTVGEHIAYVQDFNEFKRDKEADANARLIAAAPDLLTALRACVSALEMLGEEGPDLESGRAAIAKAEGGK